LSVSHKEYFYNDKEMKSIMEVLLFCVIILLGIWLYRKKTRPIEGFQQSERFLMKSDQESYDGFYSEIYDSLMLPEERSKYEVGELIKTLQPDARYSRLLEVGSGTGAFINEWKSRGFVVSGIDASEAMVAKSKSKFPSINVIKANVLDPMCYDRAEYTHIFCMDFTVYELSDIRGFFKNCYYWLQGNGYLVVHLADRERFNALIPAAKPVILDSLEQLGPERIVKTEIDFLDFIYTSDYVTKGSSVRHVETFQDKQTQNIRQNERTLTFYSMEEVLALAREAGFVGRGGFSLTGGPRRDAAQQILILERTS
jgi:ubiquinone/menaquinone biosynthesis C-methylase UbiE